MKKLVLTIMAGAAIQLANAQCNELFFAEYIEGYNNNKALEIYNPKTTPVILNGVYRIVRWSNGSTVSDADITYVQSLTGTIAANSTFTAILDKRDPSGTGPDTILEASLLQIANNLVNSGKGAFYSPVYNAGTEGAKMMPFNGDDALSLQKNIAGTWTNVDIFGKIGEQPTNGSGTTNPTGGWTNTVPYNSGVGPYVTKDKTLIRKASIKNGVTTNPTLFNALAEWDSLPVGTYSNLGTHNCACPGVGINEINSLDDILVFPNPTTGIVLVGNNNINHIEVSNILGEKVFNLNTVNLRSSKDEIIDLSGFPKGVYYLKAQNDDNIVVQKVILQ